MFEKFDFHSIKPHRIQLNVLFNLITRNPDDKKYLGANREWIEKEKEKEKEEKAV
jgi:hypothetical protein